MKLAQMHTYYYSGLLELLHFSLRMQEPLLIRFASSCETRWHPRKKGGNIGIQPKKGY